MSVLLVIPARYESSRYPGKPLVELKGATGIAKPLIQRTWEAAGALAGIGRTVVATDDDRIRLAAEGFGAEVVMTSAEARNGTERCAEAHDLLGGGYEFVINLQGDAPLTPPWFIEALVKALRADPDAEIATPVLRTEGAALRGFRDDRAAGRVGGTTAVFGQGGRALYFSKEVIPFTGRDYPDSDPTPVFHHVGVYAYRPAALAAYPLWEEGALERLEGLEQLRFLERGRTVLCVEVQAKGRKFWELNHPHDVPRLESMMAEMGMA